MERRPSHGGVTSTVTRSDKNKDDANCDFTLHDKSFTTVLRIEVETITGPPASFASWRNAVHTPPTESDLE